MILNYACTRQLQFVRKIIFELNASKFEDVLWNGLEIALIKKNRTVTIENDMSKIGTNELELNRQLINSHHCVNAKSIHLILMALRNVCYSIHLVTNDTFL